MFNLISQNCLSGGLYNYVGEPYGNPFIWTVIDFNSMSYLIKRWDFIDFDNYELVKDDSWNFSIIIDEHVKVQYVHYKLDANYKTPTKIGPGDICYCKIWEFINQKYVERLQRMKTNMIKPLFCICNFNTIYNDAIYTEDQLKQLETFENVRVLRGFETKEPRESAYAFYQKYLRT